MSLEDEINKMQGSWKTPRLDIGFETTVAKKKEAVLLLLGKVLKATGIVSHDVHKITELGCGIGAVTNGLIEVFPEAVIHAVDFHERLIPAIRGHERVQFHQGLLVDVLRLGNLPPSDLTLLFDITGRHGFNQENIKLLHDTTAEGRLITNGDNGWLESEIFFSERFRELEVHPDLRMFPTRIWIPK